MSPYFLSKHVAHKKYYFIVISWYKSQYANLSLAYFYDFAFDYRQKTIGQNSSQTCIEQCARTGVGGDVRLQKPSLLKREVGILKLEI